MTPIMIMCWHRREIEELNDSPQRLIRASHGGGGALGAFTVHVCICTLYKQVYDILNYVFFRRLAALQKRRELRAAGIE